MPYEIDGYRAFELDAIWSYDVSDGTAPEEIIKLEEEYRNAVAKAESMLMKLRQYAEDKFK